MKDEFPEALMPLREIADHDQKIELTRDLLNLVAKTFLAHNKKLDSPVISETLDAIFKEEEKVMRLTFIEEIEARGEAKGEARAGRNMLLSVLRTKFGKVPKDTEKTILKMSDPVALESWTIQAAMCSSLKEFVEAMK